MIVFKKLKTYSGYAIAIQQMANGKQTCMDYNTEPRPQEPTPAAAAKDNKQATSLDHVVCLVQNDNDKPGACCWNVMAQQHYLLLLLLSPVKLKLAGSKHPCCRAIPPDATGKNSNMWLNFGTDHGALAQVMLYTMEWVVPSLATLGQLGDTIPWSVLVGKRKSQKKKNSGVATTQSSSSSGETSLQNVDDKWAKVRGKKHKSSDNTRRAIKSNGKPQRLVPSLSVATNAKETASHNASQFNQWVTGNIYVPQVCGDVYEYAVTGFELLPTDPNYTSSAEHAISIYLETILFGLRVAVCWLDELNEHGRFCRPVATSGRHVKIGSNELNLDLIGTPGRVAVLDPNATEVENRQADGEWIISQGEMFRGTLNIQQVTKEANLRASEYLVFNTNIAEVKVAVKVSSVAVHKYLTHPEQAWRAIDEIHAHMKSIESANARREHANERLEDANHQLQAAKDSLEKLKSIYQRSRSSSKNNQEINDGRVEDAIGGIIEAEQWVKDAREKLATAKHLLKERQHESAKLAKLPEVTDVLLAVHLTPTGLVTIMKDLSVDNFYSLQPEKCTNSLPVLWNAFLELLEEVIIPLANLGIIHPDMRPHRVRRDFEYTLQVGEGRIR